MISEVLRTTATFHSGSVAGFIEFLRGTDFVCGHNIIRHDLKYIKNAVEAAGIKITNSIDTLYLSPLLFPKKPYHSLLKDDKLQTEDVNNPLNDSKKAQALFYDEINAFCELDNELKKIFYTLLKDKDGFSAFFKYIDETSISEMENNPLYLKFTDIWPDMNLSFRIWKK